jgi:hypothetical protein
VVGEAGRVALTLGSPVEGSGGYQGYLVSGGRLAPLPTGAFLDLRSGDFYWQPGVGFVGTYELVFVRSAGEMSERIPVTIVVEGKR